MWVRRDKRRHNYGARGPVSILLHSDGPYYLSDFRSNCPYYLFDFHTAIYILLVACVRLVYPDSMIFNISYIYYRMDSYVLAETFKYLYLLFADKDESVVDIDSFIFTTEAHLLPLTLSMNDTTRNISSVSVDINVP